MGPGLTGREEVIGGNRQAAISSGAKVAWISRMVFGMRYSESGLKNAAQKSSLDSVPIQKKVGKIGGYLPYCG